MQGSKKSAKTVAAIESVFIMPMPRLRCGEPLGVDAVIQTLTGKQVLLRASQRGRPHNEVRNRRP
jgi:hypothetical protein